MQTFTKTIRESGKHTLSRKSLDNEKCFTTEDQSITGPSFKGLSMKETVSVDMRPCISNALFSFHFPFPFNLFTGTHLVY